MESVEAGVRAAMARCDASHDFAHVARVRAVAVRLAAAEGIDDARARECIELAALLHDVDDHKYGGSEDGREAERIMAGAGLPPDTRARVAAIVARVGFSSNALPSSSLAAAVAAAGEGCDADAGAPVGSRVAVAAAAAAPADDGLQLEAAVVQDADRLDAIGAIGIARCFTYGGAKGRVLYDPAVPPRVGLTRDVYRAGDGTTINHFHEKLLTLAGTMRTGAGRAAARERHAFVVAFLEQFTAEWEGAR